MPKLQHVTQDTAGQQEHGVVPRKSYACQTVPRQCEHNDKLLFGYVLAVAIAIFLALHFGLRDIHLLSRL